MAQDPSDPPNATWADIKQFGWAFLLLCPFVAVFAYGARVLVGPRAALWVAVGTVGVAVMAWGAVIVACLFVSYGHDAARALLRRRRRFHDGRG